MPTRNSTRNSRAAPGAANADNKDVNPMMKDSAVIVKNQVDRDATHTKNNSGDQQVVPQPASAPKAEGLGPLTNPALHLAGTVGAANTPLEPAKSQEACCLTDDDDHTRADDDENAVGTEEGDEEEQLQILQERQQQEDEDAAAAVAAAAALTAAAADRACQLSEEDDEDEDPCVPKPRTGSEIGAEAMDSIIEDFREGAVRQRNKRKAAHDARVTNSELDNSGATVTSGGGGNDGHNKRSKHDTGANSRHKRNLKTSKPTGAVAGSKKNKVFAKKVLDKKKSTKKDDQPSNGGGSGEGSNEPSGSQMAAMGGAAMDNGSDESGEECKSAQQPLPLEKKNGSQEEEEREEDVDLDDEDKTEDESPRKRPRGGNGLQVQVQVKEEAGEEGEKQRQQQQQNRITFAQAPWMLMPPPPPVQSQQQKKQQQNLATGTAGQQQQQQQQGQQQQQAKSGAAAAGTVKPAPADLHKCASSLSSMHSFYTNAQHRFMAQMQEIMALAMDHHVHAAVAALTAGAGGNPSTAPDILPSEDVTAISRACATALSIINNIGAPSGNAAAAAAALFSGGGGGGGSLDLGGSVGGALAAEMMPPPPPQAIAPAPASILPPQVLGNIATTLPLPLPLYLPLPGAASAPPHPLQRQLSSGMDLALLHAAAAINGSGVAAGTDLLGAGGSKQRQGALGAMVPILDGSGSFLDPTAFPGGLPLAAMQMAAFPLHMQMAAAAAAAAATATATATAAQPAHAGN